MMWKVDVGNFSGEPGYWRIRPKSSVTGKGLRSSCLGLGGIMLITSPVSTRKCRLLVLSKMGSRLWGHAATVVTSTARIRRFPRLFYLLYKSEMRHLHHFRNARDSISLLSTKVGFFSSTARFWPLPFDCFVRTFKSHDECESLKFKSCSLEIEAALFELFFEQSEPGMMKLLVHKNRCHHAVDSYLFC